MLFRCLSNLFLPTNPIVISPGVQFVTELWLRLRQTFVFSGIRTDLQCNGKQGKEIMKKQKALLTVEAALVLPLFTCTVLVLCFILKIFMLELRVQNAISRACEDIASCGYLLNKAESSMDEKREKILENVLLGNALFGLFSDHAEDYALKLFVLGYLDKDIFEKGRVRGGYSGVSFLGSGLRDGDNCTCIRVKYYVDVPFVGDLIPDIEIVQSAAAGIFSGKTIAPKDPDESGSGETVFVTKNAAVYHTSRDCTHLKLTVMKVTKEELPGKRSSDGHKYYACEFCVRKKAVPDEVYISPEGDRYHTDRNCIGLRRYVSEVSLDSIDLPKCSRCAARDEKEKEEAQDAGDR
jgi:hypothetical protein